MAQMAALSDNNCNKVNNVGIADFTCFMSLEMSVQYQTWYDNPSHVFSWMYQPVYVMSLFNVQYVTVFNIRPGMVTHLMSSHECISLLVLNIRPGMITRLMSSRECISLFMWCHFTMFIMSQCTISDLGW